MHINKYNIQKNSKRVEHDYKVRDKVIINNHAAYKYEMPYKVPFAITQCWTNSTFTLQCGAIKIRYNIHHIKPYTADKNVEYINPENNY